MFEFHWPWAALLLPIPWVLPYLWPDRGEQGEETLEGQRDTLLHPRLDELRAAFSVRRPRLQLAGWLHRALLYLLWVALIVALMRPQWLTPYTEVSTPGYDLMIAVDASHSMEALDFSVEGRQVNRMAVVKGVMGRFIDNRDGDRVGLILFGSQAFILSPLSLDRHAVHQLLDGVVPGIAGPATALGDAIALGVSKLRERPEGSRVMIVIADGDNNAGSFGPKEAALLARATGTRIYVIGVGSKQKDIPIFEDGRVRYRDDLTMDEETLQEIAGLTGGGYFRATDTRALEEISTRVGQLEKTEAEARTAFLPKPLYRWPLGIALLALLALGLFPEGRKRYLRRLASG
ncbi:VWA domain-containing protein [Thiorhodococcus mannitoliphagus]|uniref:VWA domain-containing protein n=1 Tax=Thiorhodococcus mannitoliphagus TaxID=329406 RepID=A0A6P1E1I5_9GAMM|nr:VWA domain-containing protein [Thiorhodococcus mannitoliphagus]NEX21844.1 VWA domain-containing protein [Thiorhodococcus mannitoliphagus]